jgi:hypothetical protein
MTVWPHPGSRSSTGIHSLIASPLCVTQKSNAKRIVFAMFPIPEKPPMQESSVSCFFAKKLDARVRISELRMCNAIRFAWFPGGILPVWYLYLHFSTYIPLSADDQSTEVLPAAAATPRSRPTAAGQSRQTGWHPAGEVGPYNRLAPLTADRTQKVSAVRHLHRRCNVLRRVSSACTSARRSANSWPKTMPYWRP